MKTLLLGEAPSRTSDPLRPFSGSSGDRLRLVLGGALRPSYQLANLFSAWPGRESDGKGSRWDAREARAAASALDLRGRRVVFVGRRVARAFGHERAPFLEWAEDERGFRFAVLPHPSGIVRWWNEPANVERARSFLLDAARAPLRERAGGTGERTHPPAGQALRPREQLAGR